MFIEDRINNFNSLPRKYHLLSSSVGAMPGRILGMPSWLPAIPAVPESSRAARPT
ncbi:MAG: hypothetical protein ACOZEN_08215 [Thermodesulfobacteriota bacterium]